MTPGTLLRLALAGTRADLARVALTALSAALATLAGLAALTVLAIPTPLATDGNQMRWSEQYANQLLVEPGLRGGTAFALLLLTIPVLALAGQCARLGAPARDRRLAALRLAGATPGQVSRVAMAEAGVASLLGTLAGLGVYLAGHRLLHRPDARGRLPLPTDVYPSSVGMAALVLGLPVVAALATALMLRRVATTPFGVVRRVRTRGPWPWPGLLIILGLVAFAAIRPVTLWYDRRHAELPPWLVPTLLVGGALLAMIGVVTGTGWVSHITGRLLRRYARRPAGLLASSRLMADPWMGSRTFAALLTALIFGAGAAMMTAHFRTRSAALAEDRRRFDEAVGQPHVPVAEADDFYLRAMDLVHAAVVVALVIAALGLLVAVAENVVSRRRAYAALVAGGVPRGVLGRSLLWQAVTPAVPAILVALTVGTLLVRGVFGGTVRTGGSSYSSCDAGPEICDNPATAAQHTREILVPAVERAVQVPADLLALYGAGALAAVLVTVGFGVLLLRSSTAVEELRTT
ncbi:FtsX-like permease family protein [Micromonospora sp. NPDC007271]|uniref:FtsX-like permease family protein n=1 Tax=Micromonospora sp. NPDC007271 TaxID=3154587 RepID=UPI00340A618B